MNKDEIVVGGIYACQIEIKGHKGIYTRATVIGIQTSSASSRSYVAVYLEGNPHGVTKQSVDVTELDDQIGYDATYSEAYREVNDALKQTTKAIEACKVVLAYEQSFGENDILLDSASHIATDFNMDATEDHLNNIIRDYAEIADRLKTRMDKIVKAKSWAK